MNHSHPLAFAHLFQFVCPLAIKAPSDNAAIRFTSKGRVVIPLRLRKQFLIEEGTKAFIEATPEGILLKPVSRHAIERLRGILKRKPGDKSFAEEWAEHNREEREIEERKYPRGTGSR